MKKLIGLMIASFLVPQVLFADIEGKYALMVLEDGVIINESIDETAIMDGVFGDYTKAYSVIYKGELLLCKVKQLNVIADVYCVAVGVKK
jgi:hypothetical protein